MNNTPDVIYRYRNFTSITVDLLCNDQLFFANPAEFNDPFDCSPVIENNSDVAQLREILKELISARVRGETLATLKSVRLVDAFATSHAEQVAQREAMSAVEYVAYQATDPEYDDRLLAEISILNFRIQTELRGRYEKGICCFSEDYNNPLLWSHYGDQHRGVCIGYTLNRRPRPELKQVQYGGNRTINTSLLEQAILKKNLDAIAQLDADVLLRKSPEWCYEKEWRLIGRIGLQESPLELTEVTFGYRCSAAVQHTLVKALEGRKNSIQFYKITNIPGTFQLKRSPVDIEDTIWFPVVATSGIEMFDDPDAIELA